MSDTRSIQQSVVVNKDAETVFRALVCPETMPTWFASAAETRGHEPGDSFRYEWKFDNGEMDHVIEGEYLAIDPGSLLKYTWPMGGGETTVEYRVSQENGSTTVEMLHDGWTLDADLDEQFGRYSNGWGFFLNNLKSVLEDGKDARAEAMGMKTGVAV